MARKVAAGRSDIWSWATRVDHPRRQPPPRAPLRDEPPHRNRPQHQGESRRSYSVAVDEVSTRYRSLPLVAWRKRSVRPAESSEDIQNFPPRMELLVGSSTTTAAYRAPSPTPPPLLEGISDERSLCTAPTATPVYLAVSPSLYCSCSCYCYSFLRQHLTAAAWLVASLAQDGPEVDKSLILRIIKGGQNEYFHFIRSILLSFR